MSDFNNLREANVARQAEWCLDLTPDLSFRGCELAGETGEVCNVIKKLERERQGWAGSRDTLAHLAEELADVVICADLVAIAAAIDLDAAVVAKFNATSEKVGLATRLAATCPPPPEIAPLRYRHIRTGGIYEKVGTAKMQSDEWGSMDGQVFISIDMREVAVYRSVEHSSLWVRPVDEFEVRFEIAAPSNAKED